MASPGTAFVLAEGHERHVTINLISTVLLALLLVHKLRETAQNFPDGPPPHLTIVMSEVHSHSSFPERHATNIFASLDDEKTANLAERYATYISDGVVAQERLSDFVRSDEGAATEIKLWDQLKETLEEIAPGCTTILA